MSLTVTQRPSIVNQMDRSNWNAVGNPILYKMQRKDFTFASITNSGGFVRLVLDSSFGDVSTSFVINDVVYFITDGGVYDTTGTVTASSYSAPNTLVTLSTTYISSSTGFVNNDDLRSLYRVEVEVYNASSDTMLSDAAFSYSPTSKGALTIPINVPLRSNLLADNNADLTTNETLFTDSNAFLGFYIKYREVWTGSAESQTNDSNNHYFCILGAMQIPAPYGGNIWEYLIQTDMKVTETNITSAQVLTGNGTPINVTETPDTGNIVVPIMWLVYLDYNSAAYATNTDFRFEINGVAVSGTNSTILLGTADRYTTILPIAYDTTTDLKGHPVKLEVQTGNPTAGDSPLKVISIYSIQDIA